MAARDFQRRFTRMATTRKAGTTSKPRARSTAKPKAETTPKAKPKAEVREHDGAGNYIGTEREA